MKDSAVRNPSAAHRPHQKRKRVRRGHIFRAVARSAFSVTEAAPFFQIFLVLNLPLYSPPKRSFSWMLSFLVWDRLFCSLGSSLSLVMNGCVFSISCFSLLCFLGKFVLVPAFSVAGAFRRWEILFGDGLHVERLYPLDTGTSGLRVRAASPLFEYSHGISYILGWTIGRIPYSGTNSLCTRLSA